MRLDKALEAAQCGSRKQVKRLLLTGQVEVNQLIVRQADVPVDPGTDQITVAGKVLNLPGHHYLMLNKPAGIVSAVCDVQHQPVLDLVAKDYEGLALFPVGRLDRDTEGLILLTDDGLLAYQLLQPASHVTKCYEVKVNGFVTVADVASFATGIVFHGGVRCRPAQLEILSSSLTESHVYLSITEGKFHQIKKMFLSVGKKVVFLKRLSLGSLTLDSNLGPGAFRALSAEELRQLKQL